MGIAAMTCLILIYIRSDGKFRSRAAVATSSSFHSANVDDFAICARADFLFDIAMGRQASADTSSGRVARRDDERMRTRDFPELLSDDRG